jgi:hypothetical protein
MHDHIHRQIAHSRTADLQRAQSHRARRRSFPEKPPPSIRKRAASAAAKAAQRLDAESAQRAIAR